MSQPSKSLAAVGRGIEVGCPCRCARCVASTMRLGSDLVDVVSGRDFQRGLGAASGELYDAVGHRRCDAV